MIGEKSRAHGLAVCFSCQFNLKYFCNTSKYFGLNCWQSFPTLWYWSLLLLVFFISCIENFCIKTYLSTYTENMTFISYYRVACTWCIHVTPDCFDNCSYGWKVQTQMNFGWPKRKKEKISSGEYCIMKWIDSFRINFFVEFVSWHCFVIFDNLMRCMLMQLILLNMDIYFLCVD